MASKKIIDKKAFESLCAIQCTEDEISAVLGVSALTLNRWCKVNYDMTFEDTYKQKRLGGKMSMRRRQIAMAEKSAAMAIWIGKQYLGQKEPLTELDMAKIEREKAQAEYIKTQTEILKTGKGGDIIRVEIVDDLERGASGD